MVKNFRSGVLCVEIGRQMIRDNSDLYGVIERISSDTSRFNLDSYRNRFIQLRKQQDTSLTNQPQFSYPTRPPHPLLYTNKLIVYLFIPLPSR